MKEISNPSKQVNFMLDEKLLQQFKLKAKKNNRTVSGELRRAIEKALQEEQ